MARGLLRRISGSSIGRRTCESDAGHDPSKGSDSRLGDYSAYAVGHRRRRTVANVEADCGAGRSEMVATAWVASAVLARRVQVRSHGLAGLAPPDFEAEFHRHGLLECNPGRCAEPKVVRIRRLGPFLSQRRLRLVALAGDGALVDGCRTFRWAITTTARRLEMALRLASNLLSNVASDGLGRRLTYE